jgi:lysylphosphatidylglycerol synthetase-like protein (DUF2156 family)
MDAKNRFESKTTFTLLRLEWLAALAGCVILAVLHFDEIRWPVFAGLFAIIDLVGYIPGAIAYRRSRNGRIHRAYYVLYNTAHSLLTAGVLVACWVLLVEPEWALLAVPIHLLGDRGLFGNSLKPFSVSFEPYPLPAFVAFDASHHGARANPAGERSDESRWTGHAEVMPSVIDAPEVLDVLKAYSDNPSAFLALNRRTCHFRAPGVAGLVAYRPAGRYLMQLGGPHAPAADYERLLKAFLAVVRQQRRRVVAVQLQRADARAYARYGFTVNQFGASHAVDLTEFSLRGKKFMQLRNKISRANRAGLSVRCFRQGTDQSRVLML